MRMRWWLGLIGVGYIGSAMVMSYDTDQTCLLVSTDVRPVQHPFGMHGAYAAACMKYFFGHAAWFVVIASLMLLGMRWRGVSGKQFCWYAIGLLYFTLLIALMCTHCSWRLHGGYIGYVLCTALNSLLGQQYRALFIGILLGITALWCGSIYYVSRCFALCYVPLRSALHSLTSYVGSMIIGGNKTQVPPRQEIVSSEPAAVVGDHSVQQRKRSHQRTILTRLFPKKVLVDRASLLAQCHDKAQVLHEKLLQFGIAGKVVSIAVGPVVVLFEYQPEQHIPLTKIVAREQDLALALHVRSVRIIAPIPGKGLVGFECAHDERSLISFGEGVDLLQQKAATQRVPLLFGVTTTEEPVVVDLAELPHMLVAGSTGSGKSVTLHSMMMSILGTRSPEEVRCILIDPKRLEFSMYAAVPHLLTPIVHDAHQAISVLRWLLSEMERRYKVLAEAGYKDCGSYREKCAANMPFIVVIIDELADLMMTGGKDVESLIVRIAQMARAAGIHLILATQRPSVDVITGLIKVNVPARIALRVASKIDSRTIIDRQGAEQLLGRGDMLFMGSDGVPVRMHGLYLAREEIDTMIAHVCAQWDVAHIDIAIAAKDATDISPEDTALFEQVVVLVRSLDEVSISLLQRKFKIGYNRSARMIDYLEAHGIILPSDGGKMRRVAR